jgi:glucose/mannose-6-phosphate isomerase
MINQKFRNDILNFQNQFSVGTELAEHIKLKFKPGRIYVCGMGGSSFFAEIINNLNLYHFGSSTMIRPLRGYKVPVKIEPEDLFLVISHSGNTEESLAALEELMAKNANIVIISHGGKLLEIAEAYKIPHVIIPGGTQPRLATGYFISAITQILENANLLPAGSVEDLVDSTTKLNSLINEDMALSLAKKIAGRGNCKVPIIYGQEETEGLARAAKIKFNENCKIQSFYNFFPELNHNEMVGFTKMIMQPFFIFLKSELSSPRNNLRIEKFIEVLKLNKEDYFVFEMPGNNLITQTFATYIFVDLVTLHLANSLDIDPEPVAMVEEFKGMLKKSI